ncbi:NDMA-dependent alcohol dehydrogenase [Amycolatopsis sp. GM8]|uniref:NDMA-dependent alcohol dehydrogenase n=1 Tax=Amycolatopsis sp. GM8 TaxID=2896530 RepID=UPI001F00BC62|nr:NDMA-dependent alcohol dehydrogenase [Amycolatopsis sp. GM8]
MKARAAILRGKHQNHEVVDLEVDEPQPGEVLVRMEFAGICHSDNHTKWGSAPMPIVGGHEGAGVVEKLGEGVKRVAVGDHVAMSFIPACGVCRWCASGRGNLCDLGAKILTGELANGGYRYRLDGVGIPGGAGLGTFSNYSVVDERSLVKVGNDVPLEWASLVSCGVATGWGAVVNAGNLHSGDTVAVYGAGGIGSNAVRAAVAGGASLVAVIDPAETKRDFAKASGADYVYATAEEAHADLWERTRGVGIDICVVAAGVVDSQMVNEAFKLARKGGAIVLVGLANDYAEHTIDLSGSMLTLFEKRIIGTLYGSCNPQADIPRLLGMARQGKLELDNLVTRKYALDDINQGFADMLEGRNIRGLIAHEH